MHPVDLIYSAIKDQGDVQMPATTIRGICCVTGQMTDTVPRKELLGKSFTDGALLAAPTSSRVGVSALVALSYKWERMSAWICDGETFTRLDRVGIRNAVFADLPASPWTAYATTSYKKHGAMRAVVNSGKRAIWLFETRLVDCTDREKKMDIWNTLNAALRQGFGRSILESLDCPGPIMAKVGVKEWMEFEAWARPRFKSALYAFMCYLLPSQEELKAERA